MANLKETRRKTEFRTTQLTGLGMMPMVRAFFGEGNDVQLPPEQRAHKLGDDAQGSMNCAFLVASINGKERGG